MKTDVKTSLKRALAAVLTVGCMISGCIPAALAAGPAPAAPGKSSSAPAPQQPEQKKAPEPQKPAANTPAKGATVYVNNGHYHSSSGCHEIHGPSQRMSLEDAKRKGYKPCDKCYGGGKAPGGNPKAQEEAALGAAALVVGSALVLTAVGLASDADSPSATMKIPADAYEWGGHYYYVYNGDSLDVTSWESAKKYCEDLGGHLAVISSPEENSALYSYITSIDKPNAYFGYSDRANEGSWTWVDGSAVSYTNWQSWQPGSESNDYAMFYWKNTSGTWNGGDFGGNTGRNFICEWE